MKINKIKTGFTLIETILASIVLCGAVLALGAISTRSLSQAKLNRQFETAIGCAERQLALVDYIGIDDFIDSGRMEGDSEEFERRYHWKITAESHDIENLYIVNITVSWVERNRPYNISVDTMFSGTVEPVETEEQ